MGVMSTPPTSGMTWGGGGRGWGVGWGVLVVGVRVWSGTARGAGFAALEETRRVDGQPVILSCCSAGPLLACTSCPARPQCFYAAARPLTFRVTFRMGSVGA
jgi:hypothetical protein